MCERTLPRCRWIELTLAIYIALICADFRAHAQASNETIDAAIKAKNEEVDAELKSIENHPWAGSYEQNGTDEVEVIRIAPSGKIVEFQNCMGVRYQNCGIAKVTGQEFQVKWDYGDKEGRSSSLGDRLLFVPWGNATFLIARGTVHSFCLDYRDPDLRTNSPERWNHLRVEGNAILDGKPQLPDEFKLFWDLPLISCRITSVGKVIRQDGDFNGTRKLTCTIDKGSAAHIFVGMQMYAREKRDGWNFTVTGVDAHTATLEASLRRPYNAPRVGVEVTSN